MLFYKILYKFILSYFLIYKFEKKKDFVRKNQGKTSILSKGKIQAEDADFEEVK
jgi:hypothetical protein